MLVLSLKIATRYRYYFFCFRKKNESAYLKNKISSKIIRKIKLILSEHFYSTFLFGKRRYEISDFKDWPVQSPFENTKNIYL